MWVIISRVIYIPLVSILSVLTPKNRWVKDQIEAPMVRLMDRTVMYIIFLVIIFTQNNADKRITGRGFPNTCKCFLVQCKFIFMLKINAVC